VLDGVTYEDVLFGNFYNSKLERMVNDDTTQKIAAKLSDYLRQN
jgi:hypothetical protein